MMLTALPNDWLGLVLVVFFLGLKHGLDPDHLATIDGLTRFNAQARPRLSRWSGCLFSLGHGLVVTLVAGIVAAVANEWNAPAWLEHLGAAISILFLLALGVANLVAVFGAPSDQAVRIAGLKGRWLGRFAGTSHPVVIAAVGAAFALSFDTLSQAALFSITASSMAGWAFSVALGIIFMLGMMITDGINGLWVGGLISRAGRRALIVSRAMSLAIAFLSLGIAGLGIAKYVSPSVAGALDNIGMAIGLGVLVLPALSFAIALRLVKPVLRQEP
jgi:high-affinity nickel-transport protein